MSAGHICSMIKHSPEALDEIERITVSHYEASAEAFWIGTKNHDVSQNTGAFLNALAPDGVQDILDLGCGPGRDLYTFKQLGHRPIGLDGSASFVAMARAHSGCPVLHQGFLGLDIGVGCFDGVFANASLFHVPSQELPQVLETCHRALRPGGILFMSNPRGDAEGWQGDRYGNYLEFEQSSAQLEAAGFSVLDHYYRLQGRPRNQQSWLAIVCQAS